mmetsp:Transcript_7565/g.20112  ORF Transcript_7565/g.20112 Transcript_7565/m.20112 type:complete len:344 (-) Transcript_7565:1865-2896(-)
MGAKVGFAPGAAVGGGTGGRKENAQSARRAVRCTGAARARARGRATVRAPKASQCENATLQSDGNEQKQAQEERVNGSQTMRSSVERAKTELLETVANIRSAQRYRKTLNENPATLVGLKGARLSELKAEIDRAIRAVEQVAPDVAPLLSTRGLQTLDGSWRLIFSDAREIERLARLPRGIRLTKVLQNIEISSESFVNRATVFLKPLGVFVTVVINAKFSLQPAKPNQFSGPARADVLRRLTGSRFEMARRAVQTSARGRRLNVQFVSRKIEFDRAAWGLLRVPHALRTLVSRNIVQGGTTPPGLILTYLDDDLRIGRGYTGGTFVLVRERNTDVTKASRDS